MNPLRSAPRTALATAGLLGVLLGSTPAHAEGGGGSEAAPPPPSSAACATLTATTLNETILVKNAGRAQLRFQVASCSAQTETVALSFTRTWSYTSGGETYSCAAPGWSVPPVTLRPGDKTSVDVSVPGSGCPYGSNGASSYVYATAADAATGTVLSTARASVTYKTGF